MKLKLLAISDIHSDYLAAETAYRAEKPDFVLDCGDHTELRNLFELTPHFYVNGNHEPLKITTEPNGLLLPFKIPPGVVINLKKDDLVVRIAGIDGNYSSNKDGYRVTEEALESLRSIPDKGIDILLTHESPLLVALGSKHLSLAQRVIAEIDRIRPKLVLSGHYNRFMDNLETPCGVRNIVLGEMGKGYCLINGENFTYSRRICRFK